MAGVAMESVPKQHPLAFVQHQCDLCPDSSTVYTVESLRERTLRSCQLSSFATACIQWVESRVLPEIGMSLVHQARITRDGLVRVWSSKGEADFEMLVRDFECIRIQQLSTSTGNCTLATTLQELRPRRLLPESTSSPETFATIKEWIEQCVTLHKDCSNLAIPGDMYLEGIRFLHIVGDRVVLEDNARPQKFAALSHCWGTGNHIAKSQRANIESHRKQGILVQNLPPTFKDAVEICECLGIDHLWIDSLCIIQDDAGDWHSQAARMSEVYENAFLTIAASKASDPTQGCFGQAEWVKRGEVLPGYSDILIREVCTPPVVRHRDEQQRFDWPLYQRAWVYQEVTLSSRVIHFGKNEVIWDCASRPRQGQSWSYAYRDISKPDDKAKFFTQQNFIAKWYEAVSMYSWRDLTFQSDKLPAIAALAKQQQLYRPDDQYLAGVWKSTLWFDLLWSPTDENLAASKQDYHASTEISTMNSNIPSWSWASMAAGVVWPRFSAYQPATCAQILGTTYTTHGSDIAGNIALAEITLRAPRIPLRDLVCDVSLVYFEEAVTDILNGASHLSHCMALSLIDGGAILDVPFLPPDEVIYRYRDGWTVPDPTNNRDIMIRRTSAQACIPSGCFAIPTCVPNANSPRSMFGRPGKVMLLVKEINRPSIYSTGRYVRVGIAYVDFVGACVIAKGAYGADKKRHRRAKAAYHEKYRTAIESMDTHVMTLV